MADLVIPLQGSQYDPGPSSDHGCAQEGASLILPHTLDREKQTWNLVQSITKPDVEFRSLTTQPKVQCCSPTTKPKLSNVVGLLNPRFSTLVK